MSNPAMDRDRVMACLRLISAEVQDLREQQLPLLVQPSRSAPDAHGAAAPAQAVPAARPETTTTGHGDSPDRAGRAVTPLAPRP